MAEQGTADPGPSAKTTTKAALVDVGTRLILEQGYHQTGIQDVLQAAGVPKGSFYYYFPSKEAFGREVIAQFAAAYLARLEQYLGDTTASPLTRLRRHQEDLLARFERRGCRGGCLIGNLSQELADQQPPLAGPAGRRVDQLAGAVCAAVSGGPGRGRTAGGPRSGGARRLLSRQF